MKCPKCGYLGFETGDRCRHCGYDFSLTDLVPSDEPDAADALHAIGPSADDLKIRVNPRTAGRVSRVDERPETPEATSPRQTTGLLDLDRVIGEPEAEPRPPKGVTRYLEEFPLFPQEAPADDTRRPSRAILRPPLAVRRATPEIPRAAPPPRRAPEPGLFEPPPVAGLDVPADVSAGHGEDVSAPVVRRVGATLVDLGVLATIGAAVVYFTLRLTGLQPADAAQLPWAPFAGYLLILSGGYFITFAAVGGQSIGQMACGLKVVDRNGSPPAFGTSTLRTVLWLLSTVPLGLGLWLALGPDRRTLHDRLTSTRVVRARGRVRET